MNLIEKGQLVEYLKIIDNTFPVPLNKKVNLKEYAEKLLEKATLCAEYWNGEIVGLVAGYTENIVNDMAYIALVSVLNKAQRHGIASKLIRQFCEKCNEKGIEKVHVYTDRTNTGAVKMYYNLGFEKFIVENETRPQDLHFIIDVKNIC